jgi:membrane protein
VNSPSLESLKQRASEAQRRAEKVRQRYEALVVEAKKAYEVLEERLDHSRAGRFVLDIIRGAGTVLYHLRTEPVSDRAASLSYATLLSVVPLLGVVLAIVGSVGHSYLRAHVHDAIFTFMAPGVRKSSQDYLETLIDRATSNGVASVSFVALLFSAVMLLRNVEINLNKIWGVENLRSWKMRFSLYLVILILGPVLLGVSLAGTAALRHRLVTSDAMGDAALTLGPFFAAVLGLWLLYWLAPSTRVSKRAALAGALVSASLWEIAKHAYAYYTSHFVHYNVIYGSLGAIPLFLVWVYMSWVILLFGARLTYAVQNAGSWGIAALPRAEAMRARLAARTILAAAVAVVARKPAPSITTVSRSTGVNEAAVAESARLLIRNNLLREDEEGGLVPTRPLEAISLAEVAQVVRLVGPEDPSVLGVDPASRAIAEVFSRAELASVEPLAQLNLRTLAESLVTPEARPISQAT